MCPNGLTTLYFQLVGHLLTNSHKGHHIGTKKSKACIKDIDASCFCWHSKKNHCTKKKTIFLEKRFFFLTKWFWPYGVSLFSHSCAYWISCPSFPRSSYSFFIFSHLVPFEDWCLFQPQYFNKYLFSIFTSGFCTNKVLNPKSLNKKYNFMYN